jgi:hypothetical protein
MGSLLRPARSGWATAAPDTGVSDLSFCVVVTYLKVHQYKRFRSGGRIAPDSEGHFVIDCDELVSFWSAALVAAEEEFPELLARRRTWAVKP